METTWWVLMHQGGETAEQFCLPAGADFSVQAVLSHTIKGSRPQPLACAFKHPNEWRRVMRLEVEMPAEPKPETFCVTKEDQA